MIILSGIIIIIIISIGLLVIFCIIKRKCAAKKKTSEKDLSNQQPTYEEVPHHTRMLMEGNAAYGRVIHTSKN